jgi:hypothetical protein
LSGAADFEEASMTSDQITDQEPEPGTERPGGFVALAIVAAAIGAGAALLLSPEPVRKLGRRRRSGTNSRLAALAGFLTGAGLTALLTPESGPTTRKALGSTLNRIKVGAVDRIERIRLAKVADLKEEESPASASPGAPR